MHAHDVARRLRARLARVAAVALLALAPVTHGADDRRADSAPAAALRLNFSRAPLPAGREGADYPEIPLALGGTGPVTILEIQGEGRLPPGLFVKDGKLRGRPSQAGRYDFTLEATDGGSPKQTARQAYTLLIRPAAAAAGASSSAAASDAAASAAARVLRPRTGDAIVVYRLSGEVLDRLLPPPPGAEPAAAAASAPVVDSGVTTRMLVEVLQRMLDQLEQLAAPPEQFEETVATDGPYKAVQDPAKGSSPTSTTTTPPRNVAQLREMLMPMVDVEYPTLATFEAALRGRPCGYLMELLQSAYRNRRAELPRIDCAALLEAAGSGRPWPPVSARRGQAALPDLAAVQKLLLLPENTRQALVEQSRVSKLPGNPADVRWAAERCDCARRLPDHDVVYGFHPWWRSGEQGKEPAVDFSRFHRVSVLGIQLGDDLQFKVPADWARNAGALAHLAQQHDTALDLMLLRQDWQLLEQMSQAQLQDSAVAAADAAMTRLNQSLAPGLHDLRPLLMPWWTEPAHMFSGITVMFGEATRDAEGPRAQWPSDRFEAFYRGFVVHLIERMKRSGRHLTLNLVVSDQQIGRRGPYAWDALLNLILTAERPPDELAVAAGRPASAPGGAGPQVTVRLLVTLSQPTTRSKKDLRRRIDDASELAGANRVKLLERIVPVIFNPAGEQARDFVPWELDQVNDDLAYYRFNFGGAAMWPVPVRGVGAGTQVLCLLGQNFFDQRPAAPDCPTSQASDRSSLLGGLLSDWGQRGSATLCTWVCPHRSLLRLAFQGLVLVTIAGVLLWKLSCRLRRYAPWLGWAPWLPGLAAAVIGSGLLACDPQLEAWRESGAPFYAVLALGVVIGAWYSFKPRRVQLPWKRPAGSAAATGRGATPGRAATGSTR